MNRVPPVFSGARRRWLLQLIANGIAQGLLAALAALWVGRAFGEQTLDTPLLLGGFAIGAALAAWLKAQEAVTAERLGQHYAAGVRVQLFEHLTRADPARAQGLSRGGLMLRFVTDLNGLRLWASQGIARLWASGAMLMSALLLLAWQAPTLALAAGLGLLAVTSALLLAAPRLEAAERQLRRERGRLAKSAHRRLERLQAIQQAGRGAAETARIQRDSAAVSAAAVQRARLRGLLRGAAETGGWLALVGVVLAGRAGLADGSLSLPQVFSALTLAGLMAAPLALIERAIETRHGHRVAREKLDHLLSLPSATALDASTGPPTADTEEHRSAPSDAHFHPSLGVPHV